MPTENQNGVSNGSENFWRPIDIDFQTLAITSTTCPADSFASKPVCMPIVNSSIFAMASPESVILTKDKNTYMYGRYANPTRGLFESAMAALEGAKYGMAFASGVAAISAVFDILETGSHVVAMRNVYGGTFKLLKNLPKFTGVEVDFLSVANTDTVTKAIKDNTRMVYLETPANPTMTITDLESISKAVHAVNKDIVVAVDNTFLTPIFQRPLDLGVDVVLYSCTKYIGGHSDLIMGAATTNSDALYERIYVNQRDRGGVAAPFDCYLATRSLKTLPLRMKHHAETSLKVAKFLESHPNVDKVLHPGLKSHPDHVLARKQQHGHSGMMGFYIRGGYKEASTFLSSLKILVSTASLGGDTSLACIPAKISHVQLSQAERDELGILDNYVRLSIGLEGAASIIEDIDQALKKACQ